MDKAELLWRQYQQNVDILKFYMGLLIKFNAFFYAVTGAIISYVLAQNNGNGIVKYALIFPAVISFCFGFCFLYGAKLMDVLRQEVFSIRDALGLSAAPDLGVLSILLYIFAAILFLIAVGCIVLLCKL